jgi:hypothetical protein
VGVAGHELTKDSSILYKLLVWRESTENGPSSRQCAWYDLSSTSIAPACIILIVAELDYLITVVANPAGYPITVDITASFKHPLEDTMLGLFLDYSLIKYRCETTRG